MKGFAHSRPVVALLLLVSVGLLAGCGRGQADLQAYIADVKARPGEPIEPLPRVIPPEPFEYEVGDLRDPFSGGPQEAVDDTELAGGPDDGPRPDPNRRKEVLEGFELDSLEMVGTFHIDDVLYGLIQDPDGLIHRVRPDNYLGRNHGRIVSVFDDRLELQELVPNGSGGWMYRDAKVALDDS